MAVKKDLIKTNLKSRDYELSEIIRIVNNKQKDLYIKHRVFPIDMYPSVDKQGRDVIVYIFLKEETKDLYQAWLEYELE